jgi:hypothetical protein
MSRILVWGLVGALLGGGLAMLIVIYHESESQMVIAGDLPLTEEQVRGQLAARGWIDLNLKRDERYIEASGTASGRAAHMTVDALTGRIIVDDSDND